MSTLPPKEAKDLHKAVCEATKQLQDDGYKILESHSPDPTAVINPSKDSDLYLGKREDHEGYKKIMAAARKINKQRDRDEKAMGLLSASEHSPDGILRTAMLAIRAGIIAKDVTCLAEAQAMIELVEYRLRHCVVSVKH